MDRDVYSNNNQQQQQQNTHNKLSVTRLSKIAEGETLY